MELEQFIQEAFGLRVHRGIVDRVRLWCRSRSQQSRNAFRRLWRQFRCEQQRRWPRQFELEQCVERFEFVRCIQFEQCSVEFVEFVQCVEFIQFVEFIEFIEWHAPDGAQCAIQSCGYSGREQ